MALKTFQMFTVGVIVPRWRYSFCVPWHRVHRLSIWFHSLKSLRIKCENSSSRYRSFRDGEHSNRSNVHAYYDYYRNSTWFPRFRPNSIAHVIKLLDTLRALFGRCAAIGRPRRHNLEGRRTFWRDFFSHGCDRPCVIIIL